MTQGIPIFRLDKNRLISRNGNEYLVPVLDKGNGERRIQIKGAANFGDFFSEHDAETLSKVDKFARDIDESQRS